ncbi:MAG: hypothetical protein K6A91_03625 [Clostridia bacterium]|nr:hypothetical protein [Clostridia bacterium]
MKTSRKILCILLAMILALAGPAAVFAEGGNEPSPSDGSGGASDFPASDSQMIENTTDSSRLLTREDVPEEAKISNLSDVYGVTENDKAEVLESLISDDALDDFTAAINHADGFRPVSDQDAALTLGKVETFLMNGGLGAYLNSGNLLMGSEIGLTSNKTHKVKILGADTNASGWVFVVDKDAISWWIKDEDGMGIEGALVTISYLNDNGQRITKSTPTTGGNTPGIAVFDDLPDDFFGIVDVQAPGYRSVSILDKEMQKGEYYPLVMEPTKENDLYVRGVDLSGKDMVNEETTLSLMAIDTGDLTLKVLVTKSGNSQFPSTIEIKSDNRGKTVLQIDQTSTYDFDSNTRVYYAAKRWVEQDAGLFKDADMVSIGFGSETFALDHVTVENAVCVPGSGETNVPLTQKSLNGRTEDRLGGGGWLNQGLQIFMIPVQFGMFPDGTYMLMASYDITRLDPNTQYKFSSLFQKSWNPKAYSNIKNPLEVFQKSFWENTEKVKKGQAILDSPKKIKAVANPTYDFSLSFSLFLRSCYNKETDDSYGSGGILFSGGLTAGLTEYFLITAGPVVIPLYVGFEGHMNINTTLAVNFLMDRAPTGHDQDAAWKYTTDDGWDINARIEVIAGFSVFGGVGVKGALGAAAVGYVDFDIATVLDKGQAHLLTKDPHSFIDVLYGLRIEYYLLFYSGTIKIDALQDAKRLDDSEWTSEQIAEALFENLEFSPVPLEECAEDLTLMPLTADEGPRDEYYSRSSEPEETLEGQSRIITVDSSIIPDSQVQFAATKDYTALFRLGYNGRRTDIYYQIQSPSTGNLASGLYKVFLPDNETRSVTEFVVVPNKTDNSNYVYIGAVVVDDTLTDENARMRSTDVYAMVVDLDRDYTISSVLASDPSMKGSYFYSAPRPAGRENYCSVGYAATRLTDDNGVSVDGLKGLLKASQLHTDYYISWGEDGHPEQRSFKNLGRNKIYSNGVIAPNEPSFWVVDDLKSSDKYLQVKGYGANGYYEETLRCNFRIDIEGMIALEDIKKGVADWDSIITNWQYLNGCNYFIAGDSVYWMSKSGSGSSYEWVVEKVSNGSGVLAVDDRYAMITNNDRSAVYLIGVVGDYESNFETGVTEKGYNIAKIYTITTDRDSSGKISCKLHGPLDLKFAKGSEVRCFAAAYNPSECAASGLTIAYTTQPANPDKYAEKICMWLQNADRGLLVTDVRIPNYLIIEGQHAVEVFVTVRNYGYGLENSLQYTIHDENGAQLLITNGTYDYYPSSWVFSGTELYPGDSRVDRILIRPDPNWSTNKEHAIVIEVEDHYKYDGDLDEIVNTARMASDNLTLTAENVLIGGKHFISVSMENNTLVGEKTPVIKIVMDYAPAQGTKTGSAVLFASLAESDTAVRRAPGELKFSLPTDEMIVSFDEDDEELTGQIYHFNIDMDSVWEEGLDNGLRGAYVSLVDADGVQQSNELVYLTNPAERRPDAVVGTKLDENGDPLEGAVFGLFREGEDEPLQTETSDAEGIFSFNIAEPGEYIVKETEAPKGYALDKTKYPVSAGGKGEVFELEVSNKPVTGSVKLTLTDKDHPDKMLSGAVFSVYDKDGNKVCELKETSKGVYEFGDLPYGEYTIKTEKLPSGYYSEDSRKFSITEDGAVIELAVSAEEGAPPTGDHSDIALYAALLAVSVIAIVVVFIVSRKRKR